MWLKEFKIALIESNLDALNRLIDEMPQFNTLQELEEAQYLIANAHYDAKEEKINITKILVELKKSISFLGSTYDTKTHRLNITT